MAPEPPHMTLKDARELLGVGPLAAPGDVRRGFREAAKRAHPDRPGGDEARFRRVVEAYHRLQQVKAPADRIRYTEELTLDIKEIRSIGRRRGIKILSKACWIMRGRMPTLDLDCDALTAPRRMGLQPRGPYPSIRRKSPSRRSRHPAPGSGGRAAL